MSLDLMYSVFQNKKTVYVKSRFPVYHSWSSGYAIVNSTSIYPAYTPNNTNQSFLVDFCANGDKDTVENIAYSLFMALILLASVIGNSLVVLSTVLSRQLRSRATVYFIVSLACSDLAFAVSNIPFVISLKIHSSHFCHSLSACYWLITSDSLCNIASILNLLCIAVDRYIAITMPFKYTTLLSLRRTKLIILGLWMFSFLWTLSGLFQWNPVPGIHEYLSVINNSYCANTNYYFYVASYFGVYLLSLTIMTALYLLILKVAIQQIRIIEKTKIQLDITSPKKEGKERSFDSSRDSINSLQDFTNNQEAKQKSGQRKRTRELKATKSVAIVYLAFVICWFPNLVINMIISFDNNYFPKMKEENESLFLFIFYMLVQIFPFINTMLNPIIYSFSNKQFRKGFIVVAERLLGRNRRINEYLVSKKRRTTRGFSLASNMPTVTTSTSDFSVTSQTARQSQASIHSPIQEKGRNGLDNNNYQKDNFDVHINETLWNPR